MRLFVALLLPVSVVFAPSCEKETEPIKYGSLNGFVTNDYGQPIGNVLIDIGTEYRKATDVNGAFLYEKLQAKEYNVSASKDNFITEVQSVTVFEDQTSTLNITLASGNSFLEISDTAVQVHPAGGKISLNINSNAGWTVNTAASWLIPTESSGEGNLEVEISYVASDELVDRTDTVFFVCGTIRRSLVVTQECPIKLIKYEAILGNLITGVSDSVYFYFNKPIHVESLRDNCPDCECPIHYDNTGYKTTLFLSYGCMQLAGHHPFHFTVKDQYGNQLTSTVDVNVYKSKLHLDGYITDYVLINDDREALIAAYYPSRMVRYSIEEGRILQEYDLSEYLAPLRIFKNPYNSKIYMAGTDPDTDFALPLIDLPHLYSLNPNTGEIRKEITFVPDEFDHPDYPTILPYNLGFTKTGLGIVYLKSGDGGMLYRWKMLDTSKNDSIYEYPYYDEDLDKFFVWGGVYPSFDNSKLILVHFYGLCKYGIFDSSTGRVTLVAPGLDSGAKYVVPNRLSDKILVVQTLEQFLMDLSGNVISNGMSTISTVDGLTMDFSYRSGEDDVVYGWDWFYFRIMDYSDISTVMAVYTPYRTGNIKSTIDGKYILALKFDYVYATDLYVIETETLYRNAH